MRRQKRTAKELSFGLKRMSADDKKPSRSNTKSNADEKKLKDSGKRSGASEKKPNDSAISNGSFESCKSFASGSCKQTAECSWLTKTSGIAPDIEVTDEEIASVRRDISWTEGHVHICLTGNRGVGKSTLSNALRGLHPSAPEAAPVGEVEMTTGRNRYTDPLHENIVWYDVPGAGTKTFSAWQYYYDQKLFVYDKIVLIHSSTLTEVRHPFFIQWTQLTSQTDLRILKICKLRNQECIVVRSKSDIHCRNRARRLRETPAEAITGYKNDVAVDTAKTNQQLQESKTVDELRPFVTDYAVSEMGIYQLITKESPSHDPFEQVMDDALLLHRLGL